MANTLEVSVASVLSNDAVENSACVRQNGGGGGRKLDCSGICLEGLRATVKNRSYDSCAPVEIRTEDLRNASKEPSC
jgi:hypothetical protein